MLLIINYIKYYYKNGILLFFVDRGIEGSTMEEVVLITVVEEDVVEVVAVVEAVAEEAAVVEAVVVEVACRLRWLWWLRLMSHLKYI